MIEAHGCDGAHSGAAQGGLRAFLSPMALKLLETAGQPFWGWMSGRMEGGRKKTQRSGDGWVKCSAKTTGNHQENLQIVYA